MYHKYVSIIFRVHIYVHAVLLWLYHIHEGRVAEYVSNIQPSQTRNAWMMRQRVLYSTTSACT